MNENSVICDICLDYFNPCDCYHKNGGFICEGCNTNYLDRPEDEKPLVFADNQ